MPSPTHTPRGDGLRALLFLPLGLCLLGVTAGLIETRLAFLATAQRAAGHVSALNAGGSHPQIDFIDQAGQAVSYPEGGLIAGYVVGEPVQGRYSAKAPAGTAVIEDRGALWGASVLAGVLAVTFTLGGGYHAVQWWRRRG